MQSITNKKLEWDLAKGRSLDIFILHLPWQQKGLFPIHQAWQFIIFVFYLLLVGYFATELNN